MPEHLEEVPLDALDHIASVSSYLSGRGNVWVGASEPNLEKCVAEGLGDEIKTLSQTAVTELYRTLPPKNWVVFHSKDKARIGTLKDQFVIPLDIRSPPAYISTDKDVSIGKATDKDMSIGKTIHKHVILSLGYAIFCASGKPAFISGDVVFYLLSA